MPSLALQKSLTTQFMSITGTREKDAQRVSLTIELLKNTNWNLEQACDSWFASNGSSSASGSKTKERLSKLFDEYRAATDETDTVSIEGMIKYLEDLGVDLESAGYLIPLEIVQAPCFGEITRDGFVEGWKAVGADTVAKQKAHVQGLTAQLSQDPELFKKVYKHAFICVKEKGAKALPLDNALVFWELIFKPPGPVWKTASTDWAALWLEFLKEKWTKSVNKDMWNQTLEFYKKTLQDETLSFWTEDSAWPSVIDDFVAYAKLKRGDVPETMETD